MSTQAAGVDHVYVHAPFCSRRCVYCDFAVEVASKPEGDGWLAAIKDELRLLERQGVRTSRPLATLYVGGGTPSLLPPELLDELGTTFGLPPGGEGEIEWTAEANPESFTDSVAATWARAGVNRVSLGVQTFSPEALRWMGRLHTPEDAASAVARARSAGIDNVSVDLIFGLPDSVSRSWTEDLSRALDLGVPHVSLYGLTVERGTPLDRQISEGRVEKPVEGRYRDEFLAAGEAMTKAGYVHYEVSNFALPGAESRHNQAYWNDVPYVGLGNGAHSFHGGRRWWNHRSWSQYVTEVGEGRLPQSESERPDGAQTRLERLWLDLRKADGAWIPEHSRDAWALADMWSSQGLATIVDSRIKLSVEGWLLLDSLVLELDAAMAVSIRPDGATQTALDVDD